MVRVWGGGAYLPDWAYDLADEMGIMLWTDFRNKRQSYPSHTERRD